MTTDRPAGVRPNFKLHELHAEATTMNSPAEPAVAVWSEDLADGYRGEVDHLTPAQARTYARTLMAAADAAEGH